MQLVFEFLFVVGNPGKISMGKERFKGKIEIVISWEQNVVESPNLVKFVFRFVKSFERNPRKIFFVLNALLNSL